MPKELIDLIQFGDEEMAILELGMVAISVAFHLWKSLIATGRVVVFTDNEAVRTSIIQGNLKKILMDCPMGNFSRWKRKYAVRYG